MSRVSGRPPTRAEADRAYQRLREQAETCTGSSSRDRRIQQIECRHLGLDHCLRVGEPDATNGKTVEAIFQLGRDQYTVHHVQSGCDHTEPTVLQRTNVYSVSDFE